MLFRSYHTEYSGFKFALFQLGEYLAALAMAGITATMFLGGYNGPGSDLKYIGWLVGAFWFFAKLMSIIFVIIWIRGTWPRIRVDQLLGFAWKVLLPMSIVNVLAAALYHFINPKPLAWVVTAVLLFIAWLVLTKVGAPQQIEKRVYRYAD